MMGQIGKSKSNINPTSFDVVNSLKKQSTAKKNLIDALDNVPDESSIFTEDLSHLDVASKLDFVGVQSNFRKDSQITFIQKDD